MFGKRLANPLHHTALDLSLMCERVDDRANVMCGHELTQLHLASLRINLDLGHLGAKGSDANRVLWNVTPSATQRRSTLLRRPRHERYQVQTAAICRDEAA